MDFNCGSGGGDYPLGYGRKCAPGTYTGFVEKAKEGVSKNGNPMLTLTIAIEDQGEATPEGGVRVDLHIPPAYTTGVDDLVRGLLPHRLEEWEASGRSALPGIKADELIGLDVDVEISHEEYLHKLQNRVRILPAPGVPAGG